MAKKYNKITDEEILLLFNKHTLLNRAIIAKELNCSEHATIKELAFLIDENKIKRVQYGYVLIAPRSNCECLDSKPTMKCSENGVTAYCSNCGKKFK